MSGFQDAATTTTYYTAVPNGTNIPINMPPVVDSGDYLFMFHSSSRSMTAPAGWTQMLGGASVAWWRLADGTEGGTSPNWVSAGSGGGTADYRAHAVVLRYKFDVAFSTPISHSEDWAFIDETGGVKTAHKSFSNTLPLNYEMSLFVIADTRAMLIHNDPTFGAIGENQLAGPVVWTDATQRYLDNDGTHLGQYSTPIGNFNRTDLICVAERLVGPSENTTCAVDVTLSPDGGEVNRGTRVRMRFPSPPIVENYWGILTSNTL